ncbi:MAG TPA: alpha/beta fold hydrolase [Actinopolymorphaceae bacterium]|nr:alpha/beta fold hydrolase [Actinopolymorphaceae bacterium]
MGMVTLEGTTFGYTDVGTGDPLVLVHGHPFDRTMWQPQVEHLTRAGWRVIVPDLRGYGGSTVVPERTTWDTFARDVARLLDHLGVGHHVLGGLSMGGQIVLEYYRLFSARVRALLLADTFAAAETQQGRKVRNEVADRVVREGMTSYAAELLPRMVAPSTLATMPAVAEHVLGMMRRTPAEGAAAALRARAERPDYVELLSRITVPTLVVVGSDDAFTPECDARLIHERIVGSVLEIVAGAGHLPNLERPKDFNVALDAFLDTLP